MDAFNWSIIYALFSFSAGAVSGSIAIYLSPHWKNTTARILTLLMAAVAIWSLAYGMEFISPTLLLKLWWVKIEYCGAVWIGMLLFIFVILITKKKRLLNNTGYIVLSIVPVLTILLVLTNNDHHLVWKLAWLELGGVVPAVAYIRGSGFWVFVLFSYGLLLLATIILLQSLISARGIFRNQLITVLTGIAFPWGSNMLYLFEIQSLNVLDLTPVAFTISGLAFLWGLLRYQMLSLIPLAHETMLENMSDPVIVLDSEDRILDVNRAAQTIFKINDVAPAHHELKDMLPFLYEQIVSFRQNSPIEADISFPVKTIIKQWNLRISPLLNKKQCHSGWLVVLRDITDKKAAEKALKVSERSHRIILEASPNPIVFYNETGKVTYLNPAFTKVFGWHLDELLGKKVAFVPKENWEETKNALEKTVNIPEGNYDFITRRYTKTGAVLDVSINSAMVRAEDGSSASMVVNLTDITKLKKIEHELRNTKNFIRNIIDSMPSILIGLDVDGTIMQWNAEAEKLTRVLSDQAEGCLLKDVFPVLSKHISTIGQLIQDRQVKKETRVTLKIGDKAILTDITIYPILSESVQGAVIRVDDISERARIEAMMVQSEKMLSVGGLAAGMAHEINNPLAGILQNIQVIRNRLSRDIPANIKTAQEYGINLEDLKKYMEKRNIFSLIELVRSSGHRAAQIVTNMLAFSRKSARRKSTHYLSEVMEAAIELITSDYSMKKQYDFRSIKIVKEYQERVPAVPCEKNEIQQVFLNVLKNGAEAMTDAGILAPQYIIRYFQKEDHVVVEIEDNGPGIDPDIIKRIFEPFFTTKEVGVGTGLGLSVSYFIITENHNGVITVESAAGKGATFIIRLPIERVKNTL